jgi:hypothetical protein
LRIIVAHIAALRAVDQRRLYIDGRCEVRLREIDGDQVSALAGFQRADLRV